MNGRLLIGAAALSILLGLSVAYCDHRGDGEDLGPCAGVAYAVPAATKTKTPKGDPPPRREARKDPQREERRQDVRKASPAPSASSSARRNYIDLDLDMDGC